MLDDFLIAHAVCREAFQALAALAAELRVEDDPEVKRVTDNFRAFLENKPFPHEVRLGFAKPERRKKWRFRKV